MADQNPETKPETPAQPEKQKPAEENPSEGEIRWGRTIVSILVIILVVAALGFMYRQRRSQNVDISITPPPQEGQQADEAATPPPGPTPPPSLGMLPPATRLVPPVPLPRVSGSQDDTVEPKWIAKAYQDLGFSLSVLDTWKPAASDSSLSFYDENGRLVITIEVFLASGETLPQLKQQLMASSEISNIQEVNKNAKTFLHYNIQGLKGFGYATVHKNRVYYIVDFAPQHKLLDDLKLM